MLMAIKTPLLLPFNRTISNDKIERAITSDTKADAVALTLWDKIKDWFCGTKTSEVLERIFVLTHVDEKVNTEQALSAVLAFHQLRDMAYPIHFDKFRAAVTSNKEGQYTFSFSITDVMNERRASYGTHQDDVNVIRRQLLTNAGEFLNSDRVGDRQVGTALAEVTYDGGRKVFTGVSQANQNRLFLELLNDATKDAMAMRPKLAQEWLALQMKSFDYFARLRSSLETEANMAEIALEEVEESCILSFGRSIDALYKNRMEMLAVEFNEKCQDSVKQGVISRGK